MKTKIGKLDDFMEDKYRDRLVSKVYKLLPLREEKNDTINAYIDSLLVELRGGLRIVDSFNTNPDFVSLISSIEGMRDDIDIKIFRSKVFECISIVKKLV